MRQAEVAEEDIVEYRGDATSGDYSWDIGPTWQIETDPDKTSEVEVRFIAEGAERTRVELEHRHLDRHGDGWEGVREGVDGEQGWPLYLRRYAGLFDGEGWVCGVSTVRSAPR